MRCTNPDCNGGFVRRPILLAERDTPIGLLMAVGYKLQSYEPCPDCIGGVDFCCDGLVACGDLPDNA